MNTDNNSTDKMYNINSDLNKISELIINCAFTVSNTLGCGFLEKVYENAMVIELGKRGLFVKQQYPLNVYYDNKVVGDYFADIFVNNEIIVELKTVDSINEIHEAQLLNYLKASNKKLGLIINFNKPKVQIKRMVNNI